MAETIKKYRIKQKVDSSGTLNVLHPETDASVVLIDSSVEGIEATNVQDAISSVVSRLGLVEGSLGLGGDGVSEGVAERLTNVEEKVSDLETELDNKLDRSLEYVHNIKLVVWASSWDNSSQWTEEIQFVHISKDNTPITSIRDLEQIFPAYAGKSISCLFNGEKYHKMFVSEPTISGGYWGISVSEVGPLEDPDVPMGDVKYLNMGLDDNNVEEINDTVSESFSLPSNVLSHDGGYYILPDKTGMLVVTEDLYDFYIKKTVDDKDAATLASAKTYTDEQALELKNKLSNLSGAFVFKGTADNVSLLPAASDDNVGHVYIIGEREYASNGKDWIQLGQNGDYVLYSSYMEHINSQEYIDSEQWDAIEVVSKRIDDNQADWSAKTTITDPTAGDGKITVNGTEVTVYTLPTDVVKDSSYVHTDNNFTNILKNKLNNLTVSSTNGVSDGTNTYKYELPNVITAGVYSAVQVDTKGRVIAGAIDHEVGTSSNNTPSNNLAVGGIFYEYIG